MASYRFLLNELLRLFPDTEEFKFRVKTLKRAGLSKRLAEISAMRSYQDELSNLDDKLSELQANQSIIVLHHGTEKIEVEKTADGKKLRIIYYQLTDAGAVKHFEVVRTISV